MEKTPIKVAGIGLVRWRNTIAGIMEKTPGLSLTTCFARTREKRDAFAERFGCDKEDNYENVLARDNVEAVIITAPNNKHAELTIAAANAGKHVFVDKPIATTIADAWAIVDACKDCGVKLAIGASSRRLRGHRICNKLVDDGTLHRSSSARWNWTNFLTRKDEESCRG